MESNRFGLWFAVIIFEWMVLVGTAQAAQDMFKSKKQIIIESIGEIRSGATSTIRDNAAQQLAEMTHGIDPKDLDDRMIADIVSLLDLPVGRYWVAVSLGNLGSRARIAVPKLQKLLIEEECLHVSKSAAGGIRLALTQMGITSPPPSKCK
jgi:hypothetical protein